MTEFIEQNNKGDLYDVVFIGVGTVAMYGMYYAGLRMMTIKAIDMLGEVGGGLMALYPDKYIYDVAGYSKVMAKDLVREFEKQATQYPHTLCLGEQVKTLARKDGLIELVTNKTTHYSKTVVICAGLGAYTPKKIDCKGLEDFEGKGVYYFCRNIEDFRDKNILVVGGGDSAFDYSMMLEPVAKSITHIHRNDFFGAHEDSVRKVKESSVNLKFPFWVLEELKGNDRIKQAIIKNKDSGETELLEVEAVVLNTGFVTSLGPIADWGLNIEKNSIVVDSRMRTNIEGVFAAGDIVTYDGKLKLISTGCGEAAIAVNNAKNQIDPKAKVSPGHSTEKHVIVQRKIAKQRKLLEKEQ